MNAPDSTPSASPDPASRPLPLAGLRVVEFTHMVMGPTCGMVLADMGAEVIKVEPIEGDRTRHLLGRGRRLLPDVQPQQEEHRDRPAQARRGRGSPQAGGQCRRGGRELQARHHGQVRAGLRIALPGQSAPHLRQPQGLPARPVRAPRGAGRGGANDGRPGLHDRALGRPAARGHQRERHHGRHVRGHRRVGRADPAWHHRPRAGGAERAVREQRVPGRPAHDAVRHHRQACRADARAHLGLGGVRRVHRQGRRADLPLGGE
jgi:hypothetical protein